MENPTLLHEIRTLSRTLDWEPLVEEVLRVVMAQAEATHGYLLLPEGEGLTLGAEGTCVGDAFDVHRSITMSAQALLTSPLVQNVQREGRRLVFHEALSDECLANDVFVQIHRPASVACLPVQNGEQWMGLVYLAHDTQTHAFSKKQLKAAEQLLAHATVMLHHAQRLAAVQREADARKRLEDALAAVTQATAAFTGDDYFRSLVEHLWQAFQARYVLLSTCALPTQTQVQTLAMMRDGKLAENITYALEGTPCAAVLAGHPIFYPDHLGDRYPNERGMVSYLGVPLFNAQGGVVGHLAVMDDKPMHRSPQDLSLMRLFAARAGSELERKRAEEALQQAHDELEARVEARTAELTEMNQRLGEEVAERVRTEEALQHRVAMEQLVAECSANFINLPPDQVNQGIEQALGRLGSFAECDRSYIAFFSQGNKTLEQYYGWERSPSNAAPFSQILQKKALPWLFQTVLHNEVAYVPDLEALPKAARSFRTFLEAQGIAATIRVPIVCGRRVIGMLGFDRLGKTKRWAAEDIRLLHLVAETFANALERRQNEVALRNAKQAAEAANRAKSEFLANMSHELRTPLNGILGYAQILEKADNLTRPQQTGVDVIRRSGEHLLTLINDILDLSKIEAGKLEIHPAPFHLPDFLQALADMTRLHAEQKGLSFMYDVRMALPQQVTGDERRLRQVFLNLLSNAIKFTQQGGVTFRVAAEEGVAHTPLLRFEVVDTGIGIATEQIEEIFLPFQQVGDRRFEVEGTGLGLAITQRLVDMMGGKLTVESSPKQGSTFAVVLHLPEVAVESVPPMQPLHTILGYEGPRRTLLVVDDYWENRAVLTNLLTPMGFVVQEAENGAEAVRVAEKHPPDLVLMDLVMPELDGFEATRQMRKLGLEMPVIALSASVFEHNQAESRSAGCDDFIAKPVRAALLFEKLQAYLGLTWQYADPAPHADATPAAKPFTACTEACAPPEDVAQQLYDLARMGDVQSLTQQLASLAERHPDLQPFIDTVQAPARDYDMKKIRAVLKPYLNA